MINYIHTFSFMKCHGWLEGDDGEEERDNWGEGEPPLIQEGSLGNFTPLGPGCDSRSIYCILGSFTKNLSNDISF